MEAIKRILSFVLPKHHTYNTPNDAHTQVAYWVFSRAWLGGVYSQPVVCMRRDLQKKQSKEQRHIKWQTE